MKFKHFLYSGFILSSSMLLYGCDNLYDINSNQTNETTVEPVDERLNKLTISSVGDVMIHNAQLVAQKQIDGSYDFHNNFRLIKDYISNTDLSIANLETTINKDRKLSSYPSFNSPAAILDALKDTGFDVISTINNHSLDTGQSGIPSTINEIKNKGLEYVGTRLSEEESRFITQEINNIKVGISSFSYADETNSNSYLNGIPSGASRPLLNTIDRASVSNSFNTIKEQVDLMKSDGCELIVLNLHWGEEYHQEPSSYQKELARLLINEGVDIILGSHPHVVQPIETITSDDGEHTGVVFYSLGNIISNQQEEEMGFTKSENGLLPIIDVEKIDGKVELKDIQYIPTWVSRKFIGGDNKYEYTIVPLNEDLETLSNTEGFALSDLEKSLNDTIRVVNNENISIYTK